MAEMERLVKLEDTPKRKRTSRKPDKPDKPVKQPVPDKPDKPKGPHVKTPPSSIKGTRPIQLPYPPLNKVLTDFVSTPVKTSRRAATKHLRPPVEFDLVNAAMTPPKKVSPAPPSTPIPRTSGRPRTAPKKFTPP